MVCGRIGKDDVTKLIQYYSLSRAHLRNDVSCFTQCFDFQLLTIARRFCFAGMGLGTDFAGL
jgi:hypothetical protein